MRTNWIVMTAVMAVSVTATAGAQSATTMGDASKTDPMRITYTGCVESVNHGGAFLLTTVEPSERTNDMAMKQHDGAAMPSDAATTMQNQQMPASDEKMSAMGSKAFVLAGAANLRRHVGQRVSVTGSLSDGMTGTMRPDVSTLTIKTLKVIGKSCS